MANFIPSGNGVSQGKILGQNVAVLTLGLGLICNKSRLGVFVTEWTNSNCSLLIPCSPWRSKICSCVQHWATITQCSIFYIGIYSMNLYTFRYYSIMKVLPEVTMERSALRTWTWIPSSVWGPEKQLATVAVRWSSNSCGRSCRMDGSDKAKLQL